MNIRKLIKSFVPNSVIVKTREFKKMFIRTETVAQLYINDGSTRSYLALNNYYSYLMPELITDARLKISLYSNQGKKLQVIEETLKYFESKFLDINKLLEEKNIRSACGIVTVTLKPVSQRRLMSKAIGLSASHFFMFYHSEAGSVGMVHPVALVRKINFPSSELYSSNQVIVTESLRKAIVYQGNPSGRPLQLKHSLLNADTDELVAEITNEFPAMGAKPVVFELSGLTELPPRLKLSMPLPNAKPMLCRVYDNNQYSLSHA